MKIMIAETIRSQRAEKSISQETLAEKMGVTVQAVSKWENGLSCPDIALLPDIAEYFGVTVDYLLTGAGKSSEAALPLPDDGVLRVVQALGNKVLDRKAYDKSKVFILKMPDISVQPKLNVEIWGSLSAEGDINGSVQCGSGVNCGNVGGNISCGDGVNCANVGGSISCGDGVNCGNVCGNIACGDEAHCGNVSGNVNSGSYVECTSIGGDVSAEGDIRCDIIKGSVKKCSGDINCDQIMGE